MTTRPPPDLTVAQQFVNLKMNPLTRGEGCMASGRLIWRFQARPSPVSRTYSLRLTYAQGQAPQVFVEEPNLVVLAAGRPIPHVYSEAPVRLCLYLPGTGEWGGRMLLDRTVVPWCALWLWYFEGWLATGEWKGGGLHPSDLIEDRGARGRHARRALAVSRRSRAA